jgi:2-methylisocitrate lyase-like PEP mutase family enzyme
MPATSQADKAQAQKAHRFRALHERSQAFLIPNPWDLGTARILERLGFEALATTSSGFAFSRGRRDYGMGRDAVLAHCREIVAATCLPVTADLENGFGDDPETVAETVRQAAAAGLAGCSIEDSTGLPDGPIYDLQLAADRVRAAAAVVAGLPYPFTLTARAENYLHGHPDLADTIRRLQAFQEAGANVLYAPGLSTREEISAVVRAVDRPVNVLMRFRECSLNVAELSDLGVKRVSIGSGLARIAFGAFLKGATELRNDGTFNLAAGAPSVREIESFFDE